MALTEEVLIAKFDCTLDCIDAMPPPSFGDSGIFSMPTKLAILLNNHGAVSQEIESEHFEPTILRVTTVIL